MGNLLDRFDDRQRTGVFQYQGGRVGNPAFEAVGAESYIYGALEGQGPEVSVRVQGRDVPAIGTMLSVAARSENLHFVAADTGLRLN